MMSRTYCITISLLIMPLSCHGRDKKKNETDTRNEIHKVSEHTVVYEKF